MAALLRLLDVRPAEVRSVVAAFGSLLFIVVAHTTLETVRDALFLAHVGAGGLGYMYIVTAALTLAVGAVSSNIGARFGVRRALVTAQIVSGVGAAAFSFLPPTELVLTGLYAFSAVCGALLVPQLWATTSALFNASQGRRLFGTIAIAGVLGAVLGTATTAGALLVLDLRWLFLVSGAAFFVSSAFIFRAPRAPSPASAAAKPAHDSWLRAFKDEPFLPRIALVVALGAATTLFADYLFKAVAAARVAPDELGPFFARYYTAMNAFALVVQVLVARRVLARLGVVGAAGVMPALMMWGSVISFVSGGALLAVFAVRAVDGALRHSVHRTGLELLYLAVPPASRERARPIIDGAITRLSQTAAAGLLILLARTAHASPRALALVAALSAFAWIGATVALRGPYVALFRRALMGGEHVEARSAEELDLASVELLVEALSSPRPPEVVAAMDALVRRGRGGLVPALILLRDEEDVLERALGLFGASARSDWLHFSERLLSDRRDRVRRAAMRARARARNDEAHDAAVERPWIRGYLAVRGDDPGRLALLTADEAGREALLGMLTALSDAGPEGGRAELLVTILEHAKPTHDREIVDLIARAAESTHATALVPRLVSMLSLRDVDAGNALHHLWRGPAEARAAVRAALASLGEPAFEELARVLADRATPRRTRIHVPLTIAAFASQDAANLLFRFFREGDDGHVRYRCLVALERMVQDHRVRTSESEVRKAAERELVEYFRLLALRHALGSSANDARQVMSRLLDDKRRQALHRVFRLLKLSFPTEDFRQVHAAVTAADAAQRANAVEFLDALLAPRRRRQVDAIRTLLRLVVEDLPDDERVARAAVLPADTVPRTLERAVSMLREDRDPLVSALAAPLAMHARDEEAAPLEALVPAEAHGR